MKKLLGCFLCVMLLVFSAPSAQALPVIYEFNLEGFNTGIDAPYGTVTLEAVDADSDSSVDDISVTVSLADELGFIRTGAGGGSNFLFNANGVTLSDIDPGVWAVDAEINADGSLKGSPPIHVGGGFGEFDFGVSLLPLQGFGAGAPYYGDLVFYIKDVDYADFYRNADEILFAADVYSTESGLTGMIAVPEPATMFLLGAGFVVLAGIGRKKFVKK